MALRFTSDPRVRQRFNQISENFETANERTKTSLFTFSESYIRPCLETLQPCLLSFQTCLEASCQPCCAVRDDLRRHRQPRYARRGRERAAFDFYDEWDEEDEEWGNDEMERLLTGDDTPQPSRRPGMNYGYGTRGINRRGTGGKDPLADDPTVVPQSSIFGFLERLPWKIGGRGARYRPSPSNLRVNVGKRGPEAEALLEEDEEEAEANKGKQRRPRSSTVGSRGSSNSLSSRGDIFPSDDEDDAREIDDETALALGRRNTGATSDDLSSKKRKGNSRTSTKSASSKESKDTDDDDQVRSMSSERLSTEAAALDEAVPTLDDLKREEDEAQRTEERQVEQQRAAAHRLASQLGLSQPSSPREGMSEPVYATDNPNYSSLPVSPIQPTSPLSLDAGTEDRSLPETRTADAVANDINTKPAT